MTETTSQVATLHASDAREHAGSVGRPLLGTDVTVVDEALNPLPAGERGELVVSGPTVTPGYLSAEAGRERFCEHGLRTGDVGYVDADGYLHVGGRQADQIVTGGENVHPEEVAGVLRDHPAVEAVAVVGIPDDEWGERVGALVVRDGDVTGDDLRAFCDERLAGYKRPRTVRFADALPRTASGTVDRAAVVDALAGDN